MDMQYLEHLAMKHTLNACYMADMETYELLYLNDMLKKLIGVKDNSYVGRKCYEVLQGKDNICSFCPNNKLKENEFYKWEYYNPILKDNFQLTDTMVYAEGRKIRIESVFNTNSYVDQLKELQTQLTLEETLLKCAKSLSEYSDKEIAISEMLKTLGGFYQSDRAFIFEKTDDEIHLDNTYEWVSNDIKAEIDNLQGIDIEVVADWFERFETHGAFFITSLKGDVNFDSQAYKILEPQGIESLLAAPLKIGNKIIGFIGLDNPKEKTQDSALLRSVALFVTHHIDTRRLLSKLEKLSYIDDFTGFYNRNKYMQSIEQIISDQVDDVGIACLDINGLKQVNDDYGQEFGDNLLLQVAGKIKSCFETKLFRVGGDEFVVFFMNGSRSSFEKKVLNLRKILNVRGDMSVSIGSSWCVEAENISTQISYADELMCIDKQKYYASHLSKGKKYKATSVAELHHAIQSDEFFILLQPKVSISNEKVVGAEALVRKRDGKGGFIPPDKFISIYELDGVLPMVDLFVLESVCKILNKWKADSHELINISVNFARSTILEFEIAKRANDLCQKYGIDSKYITIELTEHISNISFENLNEILEEIKSFGFKISLDDFGREYANLSILSNIAFNEVKLDKSLIDAIAYRPETSISVRCIVEMCNAYRPTKMVVEGIETYEQIQKLRELKCDLDVVQGYYFSKPISEENFLEYYLSHN